MKKKISAEMAAMVFVRDNGRCRACGMADPHNLAADHIVPESLGGPTTLDNLQALCGFCNGCKGTTIVEPLTIRPSVAGFGDFAEVMQNRENFRDHVAKCRKRMVKIAADNVRAWKSNNVPVSIIRQRIGRLVDSRNVQKVIWEASHDNGKLNVEMMKSLSS